MRSSRAVWVLFVLLGMAAPAAAESPSLLDDSAEEDEAPPAKELPRELSEALMAKLRAFHQGQSPCILYPPAFTADTDETLRTMARQLRAAGLRAEDVEQLQTLFVSWSVPIERKAHKLSPSEEFRQATLGLLSPKERPRYEAALARREEEMALLDFTMATLSKPQASADAKAAFDKQSESARRAIQEAWKAHPDWLLSNSFRIEVESEDTDERLTAAAQAVQSAFKKQGVWPERAALEKTTGPLVDTQGKPLTYLLRDIGVAIGSQSFVGDWRCVSAEGIRTVGSADSCQKAVQARISRADAKSRDFGARVILAGKGFKIFSFTPEGLAKRLNFRPGDTLLSVNGDPLDTFDKWPKVVGLLQEKQTVIYEVLREGAVVTLTVTVEDPAKNPPTP